MAPLAESRQRARSRSSAGPQTRECGALHRPPLRAARRRSAQGLKFRPHARVRSAVFAVQAR